MADSATIPTHLDTPEISTFMSSNAVDDLHAPDPSGPVAVDERGRSAQTFLVEVVARSGGVERRAVASGRDIYAVTAPLVVEAAFRILAGTEQGVVPLARSWGGPSPVGATLAHWAVGAVTVAAGWLLVRLGLRLRRRNMRAPR